MYQYIFVRELINRVEIVIVFDGGGLILLSRCCFGGFRVSFSLFECLFRPVWKGIGELE